MYRILTKQHYKQNEIFIAFYIISEGLGYGYFYKPMQIRVNKGQKLK